MGGEQANALRANDPGRTAKTSVWMIPRVQPGPLQTVLFRDVFPGAPARRAQFTKIPSCLAWPSPLISRTSKDSSRTTTSGFSRTTQS